MQAARNIQSDRYKCFEFNKNGDMTQSFISKNLNLNKEVKNILNTAVSKLNLSARSYFRIIKVSQTIADLEAQEEIRPEHIQEALSFRFS